MLSYVVSHLCVTCSCLESIPACIEWKQLNILNILYYILNWRGNTLVSCHSYHMADLCPVTLFLSFAILWNISYISSFTSTLHILTYDFQEGIKTHSSLLCKNCFFYFLKTLLSVCPLLSLSFFVLFSPIYIQEEAQSNSVPCCSFKGKRKPHTVSGEMAH